MGGVYAGIGSRETPDDVLIVMEALAETLARQGWILRSGGARGADSAFERGCDMGRGKKEIFLPWKEYEGNSSGLWRPSSEAFGMAAGLHPNWGRLKEGARKMMARNCHQILGGTLQSPVKFVCCWTKDGATSRAERTPDSGGTGQAIALASESAIPVYNLRRPEHMAKAESIAGAEAIAAVIRRLEGAENGISTKEKIRSTRGGFSPNL